MVSTKQVMELMRSQTKESKATQEHINSRKYLPILGQKDKGGIHVPGSKGWDHMVVTGTKEKEMILQEQNREDATIARDIAQGRRRGKYHGFSLPPSFQFLTKDQT